MTNSEKNQSLSEIWGRCLVGHHKSCDPNFYINQKYSFGNLEYSVEHSAYIGDDINRTFNTLESAQNYLISELIRQIDEQINSNIYNIENPGYGESDMPLEYWQKLLIKFTQIKNTLIDGIKDERINFEEKYWELKKENENLKYEKEYAGDILLDNGVDDRDNLSDPFGLRLSIGARIEKLIKSLKN